MKPAALKMANITKRFPGVTALSDVTLEVESGTIHSLIGENGAGKSTLMNVLMGVHRQDAGDIYIDGEKREIGSPTEAIRCGIGMVPQELNLIPDLTVAENVFLGNERKNRGRMDWRETNLQAEALMQEFGAKIDVRRKVRHLSAAYQQIVQIARCIAMGANILILDEPTASLTVQEVRQLFDNMLKLKKKGKTIIFITHHLSEVREISDRLSVMRDGKMIETGNIADYEIDDMIRLMSNKEVTHLEKKRKYVFSECKFRVENFSRENEFQSVSFEVGKGEIFGIGGLVGAGRTELVNAIFGVTKKKTGSTYIDGREVQITSPIAAIRCGIGYVPEERRRDSIFPVLSVKENLTMPMIGQLKNKWGISNRKIGRKTEEYVQKLRIKLKDIDTPIANLSGGNQQKVILARWLAKNVQILILDEPTRGIDVNAKTEIHDLLFSLAQEGITIIVISSEMDELLLLSDRVMVMHEGVCKGIIDSTDVTQEDILGLALN